VIRDTTSNVGAHKVIARALVILLCVVAGAARAESIRYELYELSDGGGRTLLEKGVRDYTVSDVAVSVNWFGSTFWSKEIPVVKGFSAGASIYRETDLTGFGLWLKDHGTGDGGFSWDWFNRESGLVYRKLQGRGRVRVTLVRSSQFQEIAAIEVLEDITLRVKSRSRFIVNDRDTHNLVIAKGSVLRFAP
jgi:hypothetical protein